MTDNRYLDWSIDSHEDCFAHTSRGTYEVFQVGADVYEARWCADDTDDYLLLGDFGTPDEAENACQDHYETWRPA